MLIWKGNIQNNPAPKSWDNRREDMLKELGSTAGECIIKKNKPMFVYLKSPRLGYLRSNNFGMPKFSKSKPKSYINGWYILMKYNFNDPQWLKDYYNEIKANPYYYTKIFEGKTCPYTEALWGVGSGTRNFTVEQCAAFTRKNQQGDESMRLFTYRPDTGNCYGPNNIKDQCNGFQNLVSVVYGRKGWDQYKLDPTIY